MLREFLETKFPRSAFDHLDRGRCKGAAHAAARASSRTLGQQPTSPAAQRRLHNNCPHQRKTGANDGDGVLHGCPIKYRCFFVLSCQIECRELAPSFSQARQRGNGLTRSVFQTMLDFVADGLEEVDAKYRSNACAWSGQLRYRHKGAGSKRTSHLAGKCQ